MKSVIINCRCHDIGLIVFVATVYVIAVEILGLNFGPCGLGLSLVDRRS